jgi:hypothetical protein
MLNLRIPSLLRSSAYVVLVALLASLSGCYNTYRVAPDEFRKLQSATAVGEDAKLQAKISAEELTKLQTRGENEPVAVTSLKNEQVAVTRDTKLFARSEGGRRYQITPFNFSMASSQLVASDRDTLVPLNDLASYEVDLFSTGKTVGIISAGVVAAVGVIVVIVITAGKKSNFE